MKKIHFLPFAVIIGAAIFAFSCSYNPASTPPPTAKMDFHQNFHGSYDIFPVDTADKNGNNPDIIQLQGAKTTVQDIVSDTAIDFAFKSPSAKIRTYQLINQVAGALIDSNYFYQDPNGDLYRYNFGFNLLNQFPFLVTAIGSNVDVGWVLAAKMTSSSGTTWNARTDSVFIQLVGIYAYLTSQGQMMNDTTFLIGASTVKARHARNIVTATAGGGAPNGESGSVIIDSYYSTDINGVVCDLFRHVTLTGTLLKQQAQGKFKIMTSYTK